MGLMEDLGEGVVALDSAIFIYFIERHPTFLSLVRPVFQAIDDGAPPGVTSAVTLLECLVAPYRRHDARLAERYEALLTRSRNLTLVDLDRGLLRTAAQLRATHRLKTPDAIQIAAGFHLGAGTYLTNDRRLPTVPGIRILQLADYAPPPARGKG